MQCTLYRTMHTGTGEKWDSLFGEYMSANWENINCMYKQLRSCLPKIFCVKSTAFKKLLLQKKLKNTFLVMSPISQVLGWSKIALFCSTKQFMILLHFLIQHSHLTIRNKTNQWKITSSFLQSKGKMYKMSHAQKDKLSAINRNRANHFLLETVRRKLPFVENVTERTNGDDH